MLFRSQDKLAAADLVITGEGAIDDSTLMGKGVGQIASACAKRKVPCVGLAGTVSRTREISKAFFVLRALTDLTTKKDAQGRSAHFLSFLASEAAEQIADRRLGIRDTKQKHKMEHRR